jgi:hypothetical protein
MRDLHQALAICNGGLLNMCLLVVSMTCANGITAPFWSTMVASMPLLY